MSYTTQAALESRFGVDELIQLTDLYAQGVPDAERVSAAIAAAERLADGYLAARYTLPLEQALIDGSSLPDKVADIARYHLYDNAPTDQVERAYRDAVAWLKDVAAGRATLGEQDTTQAAPGRALRGRGVSGFDWDAY